MRVGWGAERERFPCCPMRLPALRLDWAPGARKRAKSLADARRQVKVDARRIPYRAKMPSRGN